MWDLPLKGAKVRKFSYREMAIEFYKRNKFSSAGNGGDEHFFGKNGEVILFLKSQKDHILEGREKPGLGSVFVPSILGDIKTYIKRIDLKNGNVYYPVRAGSVVGYDLVDKRSSIDEELIIKEDTVMKKNDGINIPVCRLYVEKPISDYSVDSIVFIIYGANEIENDPEVGFVSEVKKYVKENGLEEQYENQNLFAVITCWPTSGRPVPRVTEWEKEGWCIIVPS